MLFRSLLYAGLRGAPFSSCTPVRPHLIPGPQRGALSPSRTPRDTLSRTTEGGPPFFRNSRRTLVFSRTLGVLPFLSQDSPVPSPPEGLSPLFPPESSGFCPCTQQAWGSARARLQREGKGAWWEGGREGGREGRNRGGWEDRQWDGRLGKKGWREV